MKKVTLEKIIDVLNANIENANITVEQADRDLREFGMDSILFIQTVVSFEEEFDCEIPDEKLFLLELNTVNKMYEVLTSIEKEAE